MHNLTINHKRSKKCFNADILDDNNFKSFEYKTKLLGNTVAQTNNSAYRILENAKLLCN